MKKMKLDIQLFNGSVAIQTITETTDINTNQSTFTIPAKMTTTGATYNNSNASMTLQWKYESGNTWTNISKQTFKIGKNSSVTKSWTLTLDHNPDGTLANIQFRVSWYITDSTKGTTGATTFAPTTIPRKSVIQSITSGTTNYAPALKWTPASSSFKFRIRYSYSNWSYLTDWITPNSTAQQTFDSYTITGSSIAPYMTNTTSASVIATLYTYTSDGNLVGDSNVNFNVSLNSNIVPFVGFSSVSEAGSVPSSWGIYVKSKSRVALSLSANGIYGSTISSYRISYYGGAVTTASATTSYLTQAGNTTFTGQATDTRGRTASVTSTINVVDYSNPTISTTQVQRCDASGNIDNNGEYMYISYGASISSCSSKNTPSAVYKVGYRVHGTGNYTYVNLTTNANSYSASGVLFSDGIKAAGSSGTKVQFSTNNTYDIQFYVKDYFMEYTNVQSLDAGFDLMNFNASGKAMAIGKVSEASSSEELFEIGIPTRFIEPIDGDLNVLNTIKTRGSYIRNINTTNQTNYYYKLAKLPATSNNNAIQLNLKGQIGNWTTNKATIDMQISNREGLKVYGAYYGNGNAFNNQTIVIYQESDGSHTIYLKNVSTYTSGSAMEMTWAGAANGTYRPTIYTNDETTTSPTGTLVWSSSTSTIGNNNAPVVLYQNSSGTQSTFSLSESIANYTYVEVYYGRNNWGEAPNSCRKGMVYGNGVMTMHLDYTYAYSSNTIDTCTTSININGTSVSFDNARSIHMTINTSKAITCANENLIEVFKVIGYK